MSDRKGGADINYREKSSPKVRKACQFMLRRVRRSAKLSLRCRQSIRIRKTRRRRKWRYRHSGLRANFDARSPEQGCWTPADFPCQSYDVEFCVQLWSHDFGAQTPEAVRMTMVRFSDTKLFGLTKGGVFQRIDNVDVDAVVRWRNGSSGVPEDRGPVHCR
jgi:hypothetical protein